jgi:hypothetical protein
MRGGVAKPPTEQRMRIVVEELMELHAQLEDVSQPVVLSMESCGVYPNILVLF